MIRFYIRSLSLLLIVALSTVAFGREMLCGFCRKGELEKEMIVSKANSKSNTFAEEDKSILGKCQKAMNSRGFGEIPFLVKGIKYNCIELNETVVFQNFNQFLEYNTTVGVCVYYVYRCDIKNERLSIDECESRAKKEVYNVFASFKKFIIKDIGLIEDNDTVCTFEVFTSFTGDCRMEISLRKDTGSVIFFDATACLDNMMTASEMN